MALMAVCTSDATTTITSTTTTTSISTAAGSSACSSAAVGGAAPVRSGQKGSLVRTLEPCKVRLKRQDCGDAPQLGRCGGAGAEARERIQQVGHASACVTWDTATSLLDRLL